MSYILRIDASPREANSISRQLADTVEKHLKTVNPSLDTKRLDLAASDLPHISNETITGFYTPLSEMTDQLKEATALSDTLIYELKHADTLLISAPMYNFSLPSSLKAWIDQIVRINETFAFNGTSFEGLVSVKRAVLVFAYGANGYAPEGDFAQMNFLEPYLKSLMTFLGIKSIDVIRIEGTTGDAETLEKAKQEASNKVSTLFIEDE